MPSDPYAKYLEPPAAAPSSSSSSDPYAKYLTPPGGAAKTAETAPDVGYTEALARTFAQGATGGLGDVAIGGASDLAGTSPTITSQRARTEAGMNMLPWYVRYPVEGLGLVAGLGTGVGELGLGARAGAALAERAAPYVTEKAASRLAGAASGAVDTGIIGGVQGAAGAKDISDAPGEALKGATEGALFGGAVGGALGAGSKSAINMQPKDIPTLEAERKAAYDTLRSKPVASSGIKESIIGAYDDLTPGELSKVSKPMRDHVGRVLNINDKVASSADDAVSYGRGLWDTANSTAHFAPVDQKVAGKVNAYLDQMMENYGYTDAANAAKQAHARLGNAEALEGLTLNTAPAWAKGQLGKEGKLYNDADTAALTKLSKYAKEDPTGFWKMFGQQLGQAATDKGIGFLAGSMHGLGLGSVGYPLAQAAVKAGVQGVRNRGAQKALDEARATLTTGHLSQARSSRLAQLLGAPKTRELALGMMQTAQGDPG